MTPEIAELARLAWWDLWYGPHSAEAYAEEGAKFEWPGYSQAIDQIRQWCRENLCDVWVDTDSDCVIESEPDFEEEFWMKVSLDRVKRAVFGDLVGNGL